MDSVEIQLRSALTSDLPGITAVEHLSFVHAGERFTPSGFTISSSIPSDRDRGGPKRLGIRLGAGLVWLRGREPWGRIYALAVHPDARGQRLGQRLLGEMIQSLRNRGAGRIFLEVRVDNTQPSSCIKPPASRLPALAQLLWPGHAGLSGWSFRSHPAIAFCITLISSSSCSSR